MLASSSVEMSWLDRDKEVAAASGAKEAIARHGHRVFVVLIFVFHRHEPLARSRQLPSSLAQADDASFCSRYCYACSNSREWASLPHTPPLQPLIARSLRTRRSPRLGSARCDLATDGLARSNPLYKVTVPLLAPSRPHVGHPTRLCPPRRGRIPLPEVKREFEPTSQARPSSLYH